jgi:hypothetical protein
VRLILSFQSHCADAITFRLRKIEEFSIAEAVQALGIREATLKSRVSRARRKVAGGLRKLLSMMPRTYALYRSSVQPRLNQKIRKFCANLGLTSNAERKVRNAVTPFSNTII